MWSSVYLSYHCSMNGWLSKIWRWLLKVAIWFFGITFIWVLIYRFVPVPYTILMFQRCVEQKWSGKEIRLEKDWVPLDKISNHLQLAVVCAEDQRFLWHPGFDFEAMKEAMEYNQKQKAKKKKRVRGASTITQQTAKNAFLFPARSYLRKGLEVYFTLLIELLWNKERIMEVYLNVIEFGDGIYGAEAASQYFFKKPAYKLTQAEAARLAAVLPAPLRFNAGKPSGYVLSRQAHIQTQMMLWGGRLDYDMKPIEEK